MESGCIVILVNLEPQGHVAALSEAYVLTLGRVNSNVLNSAPTKVIIPIFFYSSADYSSVQKLLAVFSAYFQRVLLTKIIHRVQDAGWNNRESEIFLLPNR